MDIQGPTNHLVPEIIALVDRLFPSKLASEAEQEAPKDDGLLIVMSSFRLPAGFRRDSKGSFALFSFDQITGNEFQKCDKSFPDCWMAIVEAHRLIHVKGPMTLRKIAAESPRIESKKEEPVLASAPGR